MSRTCHNCGATRPEGETQTAIDLFWRPLPGTYQCRGAEACYQQVLAAVRADGAARRAAEAGR